MWLITPCSSFSVLHLDGKVPHLRSRAHPEGLLGLGERQLAYLSIHNKVAEVTVALAKAVLAAGVMYVIENLVHRGIRGSPDFSWRTSEHVSL